MGENYGAQGNAVVRARAGCTMRYPTSVLAMPSVGTTCRHRRHSQQKHPDLLQWLVRTYSNEGELVVDPFAGSGSTGEAALAEGRRFVGWELDPKHHASAQRVLLAAAMRHRAGQ